MSKLKGVTITVNYPETTIEAAVPSEMTTLELGIFITKLVRTEPEMTSFMVVAVPDREGNALSRSQSIEEKHS